MVRANDLQPSTILIATYQSPTTSMNNQRIIIGLGNPGKTYENTRHNVGKLFLDYLTGDEKWQTNKKLGFEYLRKDSLVFAKPDCFMNESGPAVKKILSYFKEKPENTLLVHDDSDLVLGKIKFAEPKTSSAGHHGIESIEKVFGKKKFSRIRIGIRPWLAAASDEGGTPRPSKTKAISFVLKKFSKKDLGIIEKEIFPKAKELLIEWYGSGAE
jgi:PTH1 family peptidyl-tRNA hydrolase